MQTDQASLQVIEVLCDGRRPFIRDAIRVLTILALVLIGVACSNDQGELSGLRGRVEAAQKETKDLKLSITSEVAELKERIERLEAQSAKPDATKPEASPASESTTINRAIVECVKKVRSLETQPKGYGQAYAEFDAFYNFGSGRVENNNRYVDQGPTYAFNKCMASKSVPLSY